MIRRWLSPTLALLLLALPASADITFLGGGKAALPLYVSYTLAGNGADTTEDQCQTYTVPASTFQNPGDTLIINASGSFASSTDNKNARIRLNTTAGTNVAAAQATAASTVKWAITAFLVKAGAPGATSYVIHSLGNGNFNASGTGTNSSTTSITDSATLPILITGQNLTTATASSITCQYFSVWFMKGP
jgi:hypothetical protein